MKPVGVLRFPGTNCDRDVWNALALAGHDPQWVWHQDRIDINNYSAFVLPGGFSYGDYLRSGALAAKAQAMRDVKVAADKGYPVIGICNGFQILCETQLLPGALLRNEKLRFIDRWVKVKNQSSTTVIKAFEKSKVYKMPIAHADGRYHIDAEGLKSLQDNDQIWWSYEEENPNGSIQQIAGVTNKAKNVAALMPHPERAIESWMGSDDGKSFFNWNF